MANVNLMSLAYVTSVRVILLVKIADNDITYSAIRTDDEGLIPPSETQGVSRGGFL